MAITVLPIDASSGAPAFTAQQFRQALSAIMSAAPSGRPLGAISGVRAGTPSSTVALSGAGSTTWTVGAHSGVIDAESASAGPYLYAVDGTDTGTLTAANATNPRVDIIYVEIDDTTQDGSGSRGGSVGYLAGTASSSPSAPTPPHASRSIVLANISVPASGTGSPSVSWVAPIYGQRGGLWLNRSAAGALNIPTASWTTVTWGTSGIIASTGGIVYSGTAGQYSVTRDGWYNLSAGVEFAANATGSRYFRFNSTAGPIARISGPPSATSVTSVSGSVDVWLAAGSNVWVDAYQSSGGNLAVNGDSNLGTFFTVLER